MLLIFTEIIEINVCDLEKNTRKNIYLRQLSEVNSKEDKDILSKQDDDDDKKIELVENLEIEIEGDTYKSFNIVSLKN